MAYNTISQMDFGQAIASEDLTGKLYFLGAQVGETVGVNTTAGGAANVVIHTDSPSGIAVRTVFKGITKAVAGAAIAADADLASDAAGKVVTAATGDVVVGKAITAAGEENEVITINFFGDGRRTAA
ncbi:MAG: hypothetical protein CMH22_04900 [Methylophaga sp.]|nr:hypothetical protein [Methylophaga sp.]|tara:strand:+ start:50563 stop:50943 length:381 start_codon:yes stop_codon:yes gene_type:complete